MSRDKLFVLISGKANSGKDCAAKTIHQELTYGLGFPQVEIRRLSYALKAVYCEENNLSLKRMLEDDKFKESHRGGLIATGQKMREKDQGAMAKDFLKRALLSMEECKENLPPGIPAVVIVPDLRLPIEREVIMSSPECNAFFVRVETSLENRLARGHEPSPADTDDTECALDGKDFWDFVLVNDLPVDHERGLTAQVLNLTIKHLMKRTW